MSTRTDLEVTEAEVRSRDGRCALFVCNVASEPEVEATFAAIRISSVRCTASSTVPASCATAC